MLATRPKVHGKSYARPVRVSTEQHNAILLAYAQEILKYESAQLNIHFAFRGSEHPCPCDDCRGVEKYPAPFFYFARQVVRRADWMNEQEKLAREMLDAGRAQQAKFVSPIPDTARIHVLADTDLAIGEAEELVNAIGV